MADITGTNAWIGTRRNGREQIASMTRLSLNIIHGTNTGGCSSPDCRGQPDTGADSDPVALADWNLEFLWSSNATDVGITRDAGDGKNVHGDSNDGDQLRVHR